METEGFGLLRVSSFGFSKEVAFFILNDEKFE